MRIASFLFGAGLAALAMAIRLISFPDISDGPQVLALGGLVFVMAAGAAWKVSDNSIWMKLGVAGNLGILGHAIVQWRSTYQREELFLAAVPLLLAGIWMWLRNRLIAESGP